MGAILIAHIALLLFTRFDSVITIKSKMPYSQGGGRYLSVSNVVMDENGNAYSIYNVLLLMHFTSAEVWASLEEGKKYRVKGYGIRVPILGWFPNITSVVPAA
jgi:hypothetical protein